MNITIKKEQPQGFAQISLTEKDIATTSIDKSSIKIEIGIGKRKDVKPRSIFILPRKVVTVAKMQKVKKFAISADDFKFKQLKLNDTELGKIVASNLLLGNYEFNKLKTAPKEGWKEVTDVVILDASSEFEKGVKEGIIIGNQVNECRDLNNTPGGDMTPQLLAQETKKASTGLPIKVSIFDKKKITELKMGGILGVSQGSDEDPRFIIMEYKGGGDKKPIVLVGKGITFDSGGLNVKSGSGMYEMHMDMSGAGVVIHAIIAAARLKLKQNIITLVPAAENMPSGSSYRPGDVIKSMSGKTIEVMNTDAEGRVILADALHYAKKYKPAYVIDVATLTGASLTALGQRANVIFSKDETLIKKAKDAGERAGDYVWELPLWDEYEADIKGTFGDVSNTGKNRYGGVITAAMFLYQFIKDYKTKWMHIDNAPRMTSIEEDALAKGATGSPVQMLLELLQRI